MDTTLNKFRLGKAPARKDPRNFKLAKYLSALPSPPSKIDWLKRVKTYPMMMNDQLGDCTIAGAAHLLQVWNGRVIADEDVVKFYSAVSGYDPKTGANDNGAVLLDVLNKWRRKGIFPEEPITAFVEINPKDRNEVRVAIDLFGGIYTGLMLPYSAQKQVGKTWAPSKGADGAPGSWGGHCVPIGRYSSEQLSCVTWGAQQKMTWKFFSEYCDECYAILSQDWIGQTNRVAPSGFSFEQLQADLGLL